MFFPNWQKNLCNWRIFSIFWSNKFSTFGEKQVRFSRILRWLLGSRLKFSQLRNSQFWQEKLKTWQKSLFLKMICSLNYGVSWTAVFWWRRKEEFFPGLLKTQNLASVDDFLQKVTPSLRPVPRIFGKLEFYEKKINSSLLWYWDWREKMGKNF